MKTKELKGLGNKELEEKLLEMKKELLKIRGQIAVGTIPKSPGQVKALKRGISRINFIMGEALRNKGIGGSKVLA